MFFFECFFAAHSEGGREGFMLLIGMVMTGASAGLAPKFSVLHLFVSRLLIFVRTNLGSW